MAPLAAGPLPVPFARPSPVSVSQPSPPSSASQCTTGATGPPISISAIADGANDFVFNAVGDEPTGLCDCDAGVLCSSDLEPQDMRTSGVAGLNYHDFQLQSAGPCHEAVDTFSTFSGPFPQSISSGNPNVSCVFNNDYVNVLVDDCQSASKCAPVYALKGLVDRTVNPSWSPVALSSQSDYLAAHCAILQSGQPNFSGCQFPVQTNLNTQFLRETMGVYHDPDVLALIEFGFPLNFDKTIPVGSQHLRNHKGAQDFPAAIDHYLTKEISHGAVLGPFDSNPFSCPCVLSPLNSVPKRDSEERRIIVHLSFPFGASVNSGISKDTYLGEPMKLTFPRVDDLVALVKLFGQGCALFKRDLKRAYRQIPVDPGDIHLLGYSWQGKLYFDAVLPMGLRSAALCCQRVTNLISHICRQQGLSIVNYLDDFGGAATWSDAPQAYDALGRVLSLAGLTEAADKACPPASVMTFLGVQFDTKSLTLTITPDRLIEIQSLLAQWAQKTKSTRHELQSLLGKLQFVAACVRPGRVFISRLLNFLRTTAESGSFVIPPDALADIAWWQRFLPLYNGVSMMPWEEWSQPDGVVSTDACLSGCGGWVEGEYFHALFPLHILLQNLHINALELLAVVVALKLWCVRWAGKRLLIYCDNMTSVQVINSGATRDVFLQSCLREICFLAAVHEFELQARHLSGVENRVADLCSRLHLSANHAALFHKENLLWQLQQREVPPEYFKFLHSW